MSKSSVSLPTKIAYGTGTMSDGVKNTTFNTFLLFFYTQVMGLSGTLAGTAILLALIVDAITDPLIGNLSDNFRSRWGRRHPFMYGAAAPMALFFVALLNPPSDMSQTALFAWMLTFTVGVRVAMTFYAVPSAALVAEITNDYDERTVLISFRILAGWIAGLLMAQLGYLYYFAPSETFADGRLDPDAYGRYAITGGLIIFFAILICARGTHHTISRLHPVAKDAEFSLRRFMQEVREALSNRAYLVLIFMVLAIATATGFTDNMNLYVNTYYWGLTAAEIGFLVYGAILGTVLGFALTPMITARSDKRTVGLWGIGMITFIGPLPVTLRLLDLMPQNGEAALLWILLVYTVFIVVVAVGLMILAGSMIADVIDQNELITGRRQEGMFNAAFSFSVKATSGVGGFFAGLLIDVIDFPTGATVEDVSSDMLVALGVGVGPMIFGFWVLALLIFSRYPLTREKHNRILEELAERRGDSPSVPSSA